VSQDSQTVQTQAATDWNELKGKCTKVRRCALIIQDRPMRAQLNNFIDHLGLRVAFEQFAAHRIE
jgi:hypothetical protein